MRVPVFLVIYEPYQRLERVSVIIGYECCSLYFLQKFKGYIFALHGSLAGELKSADRSSFIAILSRSIDCIYRSIRYIVSMTTY